jgi:hypothetical protein
MRVFGAEMSAPKPAPLKLYYVADRTEFECDFVIARSKAQALRVFSEMYGGLRGDCQLVLRVPPSLSLFAGPCWLGPSAPELERLGGVRVDGGSANEFPQWNFGTGRTFGCTLKLEERYPYPQRQH